MSLIDCTARILGTFILGRVSRLREWLQLENYLFKIVTLCLYGLFVEFARLNRVWFTGLARGCTSHYVNDIFSAIILLFLEEKERQCKHTSVIKIA